ncbi:YjdF family protein [Nonomuraea sp. NPDC026600]|uniref:YjdF family protein n=1 Tax=Nonomuraea sp. NPDC026600 TaxID=3155363 RepID=UPI0033D1151F
MVTLSVYLDGPFWVGVLELIENGELRATRFTLGAEPTDPELHDYLMRHGLALLAQASSAPPVPAGQGREDGRVNPKRAAKLAARAAARVSRARHRRFAPRSLGVLPGAFGPSQARASPRAPTLRHG